MKWFILLALFSLPFMLELFDSLKTILETLPQPITYFVSGMAFGFMIYEFLRAKSLNESIKDQNKTIEELKIRIKDESPKSKYWELSNRQLKGRVFAHTKKIKSLEDASSRIRAEEENGIISESIALRDELWERLPFRCRAGEGCKKEYGCLGLYNTLEYRHFVPLDLHRMAMTLPD